MGARRTERVQGRVGCVNPGHPSPYSRACRGMSHPVNERFVPMPHFVQEECIKGHPDSFSEVCRPYPGWALSKDKASVDRIALFHYTTRSLEDFHIKQARAGGNNPNGKPDSYFNVMARCGSSLANSVLLFNCDSHLHCSRSPVSPS
jgi:hypothetical protein